MSNLHVHEPEPAGRPGRSSGLAVIAWLLLATAVIPFAMAAHGEGEAPLSIALAMTAVGAVLLAVAHVRRRG